MLVQTVFLLCLFMAPIKPLDPELEEEAVAAVHFLKYINKRTLDRYRRVAEAGWNYSVNISDDTARMKLEVQKKTAEEAKTDWLETVKFRWKTYNDPTMRREFKLHSLLGTAALPNKKYERLTRIINEMQKIYSTAKVCEYKNTDNCALGLDPELTKIFRESRNPSELKHYWTKWRKAVGPKVKTLYGDYVTLSNKAANLNNFTDNAHFWLDDFEAVDIREQIESLWQQVNPLYLQIHAYVRFKLKEKYGDLIDENGPIPAHLLGNMWAQEWGDIVDFTLPYPEVEEFNITQEMIEQEYTPLKMFQLANDFFVSINLTAVPDSFWEKSVLEKPKDGREIVCHASAWDFFHENDVRIKQCTTVDETDFYTVHHEMGHIQYYLQYAHQPVIFRTGANSGFHEAVGDVITLSVKSPKHLARIGLINSTSLDEKVLLNILYSTGLRKITFLPYAYIMDLWRWNVFQGKIKKEDWNCKWWELREEYQGILPPTTRSEQDFDIGAKYHVPADVPYIRYFISFIIQFQFHKALCIKAGQYKPDDPSKKLHECDIYQNKEAGTLLGQMLKMGASKPWPDAMEVLTGQRTMDASGLLEFFRPLQLWLENENERNNVSIGWEVTEKRCRPHELDIEGAVPQDENEDESE